MYDGLYKNYFKYSKLWDSDYNMFNPYNAEIYL